MHMQWWTQIASVVRGNRKEKFFLQTNMKQLLYNLPLITYKLIATHLALLLTLLYLLLFASPSSRLAYLSQVWMHLLASCLTLFLLQSFRIDTLFLVLALLGYGQVLVMQGVE